MYIKTVFVNNTQVRFARTGLVILPVQVRGPRRAKQQVGRSAGHILGVGGGRVANRRESAHHGTIAAGAQVSCAVWLRASAIRRAGHD